MQNDGLNVSFFNTVWSVVCIVIDGQAELND
jgi:hypothetical protein